MKHFLLSVVCFCLTTPDLRADEATEDLASKLEKVVSLKDPIDAKLDLALTELADEHGLQGKIIVDAEAFKADGVEDVLGTMVKLTTVNGVRLRVVFDKLLRQVNGAYIVRHGHIDVVPQAALRAELNLSDTDPEAPYRQTMPLVRVDLKDAPLAKALADLGTQWEKTIILAPQVGEKADTTVTARLVNVPLDTAVELLAEMTDLKLVRKANVLFVTTPERAESMLAAEEKRREVSHERERMQLERQKIEASKPAAPAPK